MGNACPFGVLLPPLYHSRLRGATFLFHDPGDNAAGELRELAPLLILVTITVARRYKVKPRKSLRGLDFLAGATGLEPAANGFGVRYSAN